MTRGEARAAWFYESTRIILVVATTAASVVGGCLTVALLAIGLARMVLSIAAYVGLREFPAEIAGDRAAAVLDECIHGLEFLFLAPLPFLIPVSLGRYIRDSKENRDDRQSKADLLSIKALTAALLIAVLASDVVGTALSSDGLHYETAISSTLVIGVLALYFFGLERQAKTVHDSVDETRAGPEASPGPDREPTGSRGPGSTPGS